MGLAALALALGAGCSEDEQCAPESSRGSLGVMVVGAEQVASWQAHHATLPVYAAAPSTGTSASVLGLVQYNPGERDQGTCGDCWAWAGTALLDVALARPDGDAPLSVQWVDAISSEPPVVSEFSGSPFHFKGPCCGGTLGLFADTFNSVGNWTVPATNTNASFADLNQSQAKRECLSSVPATDIQTTGAISFGQLSVRGLDMSQPAEDLIGSAKSALDAGQAIYVSFYLPTTASWRQFDDFWLDGAADTLWSFGPYCGEKFDACNGGAGHAVAITGYEDDGTTGGSYWTVLNSWGNPGAHVDGTFRMQMRGVDYGCQYSYDGGSLGAMQFEVLDVE